MNEVSIMIGGLIACLINMGVVIYFSSLLKVRSNRIIEFLKLHYPDKTEELLGNEMTKPSSNVSAKVAGFIRKNDSIQDSEYIELRKDYLLNSRIFLLILPIVCLTQSLIAFPIILLHKQTLPNFQGIANLVIFYGLSAFLWLGYQIYLPNKRANSISIGREESKALEDNKSVVNFEMSKFFKFLCYTFPFISQCFGFLLIAFILIYGLFSNHNLVESLKGCAFLFLLINGVGFIGFWKTKKARVVSMLTIDKEKKIFCAYIHNIKKKICFGVDDIYEVNSNTDMLRFYLKDGTWISWFKNEMNQKSLEEIIKSFDFVIKDKNL